MLLKTRSEIKTKTLTIIFAIAFIATGIYLKINFSSQAPEKKWGEPWQNACEETSIVIIDSFYNNKPLNKEIAKKEILNILDIKEKEFGSSFDENAEKIVSLINNFLNWEAWIVENPAIEQIKNQIDNKNPIILPVDGRKLPNKYFNASGYHVFVISGYDENKKALIAQEPGTQFGKNYPYPYQDIMNAIHDYNPDNLNKGKRVAIFTNPVIKISANTDGDDDGLKKIDEINYKTNLTLSDTDGDGYNDGQEVTRGYSPTISEKNIKNGDLIRIKGNPKVYLIQNNKKRHILNADVFRQIGRSWGEIGEGGINSLNSFELGKPIDRWPE